jgi:hypothetical protein
MQAEVGALPRSVKRAAEQKQFAGCQEWVFVTTAPFTAGVSTIAVLTDGAAECKRNCCAWGDTQLAVVIPLILYF